ncbi:hypothetical protein BV898_13020 [Hypsibius exemplaris]|uniref:WAP domain-containing protein n=1 Tax=Hypsibius exemplaris TaxID=2072580 RepID=A0A1W0WBW4_HYPEX|nr:hypothetical protein BV898_13020 [Hypsibius exemplaris]
METYRVALLCALALSMTANASSLINAVQLPIVVPKFGYCPSNPLWDNTICPFACKFQCNDDSNCPGVKKCCKTQSCCATCEDPTCTPPPVVKPGKCPFVTGRGICLERCRGDDSCPGAQKCCSNGCGHVCKAPRVNPDHEGQCPLLKAAVERSVCLPVCSTDDDCAQEQKCCPGGPCGRTCQLALQIS